jgi:hypothetical protein
MGRPRKDSTELIDAVLLRWAELGTDPRLLDVAIRDVAAAPPKDLKDPRGGKINRRKFLRRQLCKLDAAALRANLLAARQRARPPFEFAGKEPAPGPTLAEAFALIAATDKISTATQPAQALREMAAKGDGSRALTAVFEPLIARIRTPKYRR